MNGVFEVTSNGIYRIYWNNHPGRLLNFWTFRVGAYSRWVLIRGWALIKFAPFSASVVCLFCNNTINGSNKTRRCNKERFLQNTLKKTPSPGKSLISTYLMFFGLEGPETGWGGGVGTYLSLRLRGREAGWGWALIRGWVLIR